MLKLGKLISNNNWPLLIGAIQKLITPLPLPIREAIDFLVTDTKGNTRIHNKPALEIPRLIVRLQASICLNVNLPDSKDCKPYWPNRKKKAFCSNEVKKLE